MDTKPIFETGDVVVYYLHSGGYCDGYGQTYVVGTREKNNKLHYVVTFENFPSITVEYEACLFERYYRLSVKSKRQKLLDKLLR